MFENIERIPLYFLALFHGIITAYIVYVLTDMDLSETYFVLFVVFCSLINVILVRLLIAVFLGLSIIFHLFILRTGYGDEPSRRARQLHVEENRAKLSRVLNFSPDDLLVRPTALYFMMCVGIGVLTGYGLATAYQKDWILAAFARTEWPKRHGRNPLDQFFWDYCNGNPKTCSPVRPDGQGQTTGDSSNSDSKRNYEYMRIWWKDSKLVTAGFLSDVPGRKDKPIVKLLAACELIIKPDYSGEEVYQRYTKNNNLFVDLSNPNILFIEVVLAQNPCEPKSASKP